MRLILHRLYILLFGLWEKMSGLSKEGKGGFFRNCFRYFHSWLFGRVQLREYCELAHATQEEKEFVSRLDAIIKEYQLKKKWGKEYFATWRFLRKYTSLKYDTSPAMFAKRIKAYRKRFDIGEGTYIQYGVMVIAEHYSYGGLKTGRNCLLARDCDLDITGGLELGDNVKILEGVKILTHAHDSLYLKNDKKLIQPQDETRAYVTGLKIGNNAQICARAIILPSVRFIGDNSLISAGAVVDKKVPPNVIVAGNPAQIVAEIPGKLTTNEDVVNGSV